jgi:hypothetical protein
MSPKRFADFAQEEGPLDGEKVKLDSVLNLEVLVTGFKVKKSKYGASNSGNCLTVQFEQAGARKIFFTGSEVLMRQFEKYGGEVPFLATIKRIDRYYTLS